MTFHYEYRIYERDIIFLMCIIFRSFPFRNLPDAASESLRHPSRSCTVCNAIPYVPSTAFLASIFRMLVHSRYLQHAWFAFMRTGDFETLTMGKASLNGRHARRRTGTQSLDYSATDFFRF